MVNQSDNAPPQKLLLDSVASALQRRPLLFWSGIWVVILLVAGLAVMGLTSPGPIEQAEQKAAEPAAPAVVAPVADPSVQTDPKLLLWLFGAIALGCAGGSILISQRLNTSEPSRKRLKPLKPYPATKSSTLQQRPKAQRSTRPVPAVRKQASAPATAQPPIRTAPPAKPQERSQVFNHSLQSRPPQVEPVVTVVPAEESHPLDWGDGNLADMMDMRKRQPLSSLL